MTVLEGPDLAPNAVSTATSSTQARRAKSKDEQRTEMGRVLVHLGSFAAAAAQGSYSLGAPRKADLDETVFICLDDWT